MNTLQASKFDVVIIGAGPAGCAAALHAARRGLKIALLDRDEVPRKAPGETLHPGVEPLFRQLGVWDEIMRAGFHRHRGIWKRQGARQNFEPYGEDLQGTWLGIQADRRTLNNILRKAVCAAGIHALWPIKSVQVLRDTDRIAGVRTPEADLISPWLFDASGSGAWLAEALDIAVEPLSAPVHCRFGWDDGEPAELDGQPCFIQDRDHWRWVAPLGDGSTAWVEACMDSATFEGGMDVTWRRRRPVARPGYFLVGDAAMTLDPSTSGGVLRAMMSGIFAADCVLRIRQGCDMSAVISDYALWMEKLTRHYTAQFGMAMA